MSTKKSEKGKYTPNQVIWYHTILWMLPAIVCFFWASAQLHNLAVGSHLLDSCEQEFENITHEECVTRYALLDAEINSQARTEAFLGIGFGVLFAFISITYNHHNRFMR